MFLSPSFIFQYTQPACADWTFVLLSFNEDWHRMNDVSLYVQMSSQQAAGSAIDSNQPCLK